MHCDNKRSEKCHFLSKKKWCSKSWIEEPCEELVNYELGELGRDYIIEDYQTIPKTLDFCLCKMEKYFRILILEEIIWMWRMKKLIVWALMRKNQPVFVGWLDLLKDEDWWKAHNTSINYRLYHLKITYTKSKCI